MNLRLKRKQDLDEQLTKDYDLLKELEDSLRYESDPRRQAKLRADITDLKDQIASHLEELDSLSKVLDPRLQDMVNLYLAASFEHDLFAELDQAGETDPDRSTLLQKVFIDLDVTIRKGKQPRDLKLEGLPQLERGVLTIEQYFAIEESEGLSAMDCLLKERCPKVAIIGGPGQGKSTLGQHLAQANRAILLGKPWEFEPQIARVPFRVVLKYFAQWLAGEPELDNLETYLASIVHRLAARPVSPEDIQEILRCRPCLLVLDGLDEVVVPELRARMLDRIREFLCRAEQLGANLTVMATSRPTGYENQFDPEQFWHLELLPLSSNKVCTFAEKWVAAKKLPEEECNRILHTLEECQEDKGLSTLLVTPLQVTIILLIIKDGGRPPAQREALFNEYWNTIFRREKSKAKGIIQSDEPLLFNLHACLGYLLHRRAAEQNVQSLLPEEEFRQAVRQFLRREDSRSSDEAINQKMDRLVREARDRLVLIVEPEPRLFGFELRSLQEFFAAVHLVQTAVDTEQRFKRLKAIACSEHWRNVALFFAGRVARNFRGEASNILELVCRPVDRGGSNPYLRPGAWLALEIAADGALGANRDLQYNAIEYGLKVLETGLTKEQQHNLQFISERLSPEDRQDILRPILEEKLRSLSVACLEPALNLWGRHFGAIPLFREKIDFLLQSERENVVLSALDLALHCEPDTGWMVERLRAYWPHWKRWLPKWWSRSPTYVEKLLRVWSPSEAEIAEVGEIIFARPGFYPYRSFWRSDKEPTWNISEPRSQMDQLIALLRALGVMGYWERRPFRTTRVEIGKWGSISLVMLEEPQRSLPVPEGIAKSLDGLVQHSDLAPWLRVQLWTLYWAINRPNVVNVSTFLGDIWTIQQAQSLPVGFWRYWSRGLWPLLTLAVERQQAKGPEAVKELLPFVDAKSQVSVGEQVARVIQEYVEQVDETQQEQLFKAILLEIGLDECLPQLVSLAERMGLTVADLVGTYVKAFTYHAPDVRQRKYTIDEFQDLLTTAEEFIDDGDRLTRLLWYLADAKWPSHLEVLNRAQRLLELVLARWTKSAEVPFADLIVVFFLNLLTCDAQIQQIAPRLFLTLSQAEPPELRFWSIREVLGKLSSRHLSELGIFLTHEDEAVRTGAAIFWKAVIDAMTRIREPWEDEVWEGKDIRFAPKLGLGLINSENSRRRLEGIALLTLSDYPVEDVKYRDVLLGALQQPQSGEEEQAWASLLREIPISEERHSKWCNLLEEILDEPQNFSGLVLSAAMERYQRLINAADVAFSEAEERELGLP
jgi:hypothetical protein